MSESDLRDANLEVERLRMLVLEAFAEGYNIGDGRVGARRYSASSFVADPSWLDSDTKRALDADSR